MKPRPGSIGWIDLAVSDASGVKDFYAKVVGWKPDGLNMGSYEDYCMTPPDGGEAVAGICHARGANAGLPACWLMYITVADLERSVAAVTAHGGKIVASPRSIGGYGRCCVIEDPAGACCALFEPAAG